MHAYTQTRTCTHLTYFLHTAEIKISLFVLVPTYTFQTAEKAISLLPQNVLQVRFEKKHKKNTVLDKHSKTTFASAFCKKTQKTLFQVRFEKHAI
jgi:hypothetical protein